MKLVTVPMAGSLSAFDVAGIAAVAVALTDSTIAIVDFELSSGVTADLATAINGIRLVVEVTGGAIGTAAADIPTTLRAGHHMMGTRRTLFFRHAESPTWGNNAN
jgi:hypothetical protein